MSKTFESEVRVRPAGKVANGKSQVSLLTRGAEGGSAMLVMAQGSDAEAALRALKAAVESGLSGESQ